MTDWESIGKQAVKDGYDGGGIWSDTLCSFWRKSGERSSLTFWPDFSYPETEGTALAWIAEKTGASRCYISRNGFERFTLEFEDQDGDFVRGCVTGDSAASVILAAIKSLNLGKKDNSPMGLNKRLLEVDFKLGRCSWLAPGNFETPEKMQPVIPPEKIMHAARVENYGWLPDGSHPSTIGVATAWLRSFKKIGISFHIWGALGGDRKPHYHAEHDLYESQETFGSELEALVEFAEWAKEEGLML